MDTFIDVLHDLQTNLKVPKNQFNSFGKYKFRSCEDILVAIKPALPKGYTLILSEELVCVGGKNYIRATAQLKNGSDCAEAIAYAREAESQKGMNDAQLTGSTSSYARKYALAGLLLLDDTKDSDATNDHDKQQYKNVDLRGKGLAKVKRLLLLLNDNDTELASNHLHDLIGKNRTADLTISDIDKIMPKLDKLAEERAKE